MTNDYGRTEERLIALHAEAGGRLVERASLRVRDVANGLCSSLAIGNGTTPSRWLNAYA